VDLVTRECEAKSLGRLVVVVFVAVRKVAVVDHQQGRWGPGEMLYAMATWPKFSISCSSTVMRAQARRRFANRQSARFGLVAGRGAA
jgi:hypothetical protein